MFNYDKKYESACHAGYLQNVIKKYFNEQLTKLAANINSILL